MNNFYAVVKGRGKGGGLIMSVFRSESQAKIWIDAKRIDHMVKIVSICKKPPLMEFQDGCAAIVEHVLSYAS